MNDESRFPIHDGPAGLLAVAGYQNRDKIADMLRGAGADSSAPNPGQPRGGAGGSATSGGFLDGLGGASAGGFLGGALGDLVDRFRQNGQGDVAESWVGPGSNRDIAPQQLGQAIGPDVLEALTQRTGLSRDEILARLSRELPQAVDRYTPQGRLPAEHELSRKIA